MSTGSHFFHDRWKSEDVWNFELPVATALPVTTLTRESLACLRRVAYRMHAWVVRLVPRVVRHEIRAPTMAVVPPPPLPQLLPLLLRSILIQAMSMANSRSRCPICERDERRRGVRPSVPPFLRPSVRSFFPQSSSPLHSSASERTPRRVASAPRLCTSWR